MTFIEREKYKKSRLNWKLAISIITSALTLGALLLALYSSCETRKLFVLQNQPFVDIKKLTGTDNCYYQKDSFVFSGYKLDLFNSGNFPAFIKNVAFTIGYLEKEQIDTILSVAIKVFPHDKDESGELLLFNPAIDSFLIKIKRSYPDSNITIDKLTHKITLFYKCLELDSSYQVSSAWKAISHKDYRRIK
jgi:DNA-binding XRE family transcriptional regulator